MSRKQKEQMVAGAMAAYNISENEWEAMCNKGDLTEGEQHQYNKHLVQKCMAKDNDGRELLPESDYKFILCRNGIQKLHCFKYAMFSTEWVAIQSSCYDSNNEIMFRTNPLLVRETTYSVLAAYGLEHLCDLWHSITLESCVRYGTLEQLCRAVSKDTLETLRLFGMSLPSRGDQLVEFLKEFVGKFGVKTASTVWYQETAKKQKKPVKQGNKCAKRGKQHRQYCLDSTTVQFMINTVSNRHLQESQGAVVLFDDFYYGSEIKKIADFPWAFAAARQEQYPWSEVMASWIFYCILKVFPCNQAFLGMVCNGSDAHKVNQHLFMREKTCHLLKDNNNPDSDPDLGNPTTDFFDPGSNVGLMAVKDTFDSNKGSNKKIPFALCGSMPGGRNGVMACVVEQNYWWVESSAIYCAKSMEVLDNKLSEWAYTNYAVSAAVHNNNPSITNNNNSVVMLKVYKERDAALCTVRARLVDVLKSWCKDEKSGLYDKMYARWDVVCSKLGGGGNRRGLALDHSLLYNQNNQNNQNNQENSFQDGHNSDTVLGCSKVNLDKFLKSDADMLGNITAAKSHKVEFEQCKPACKHTSHRCLRSNAVVVSMYWLQQQGISQQY